MRIFVYAVVASLMGCAVGKMHDGTSVAYGHTSGGELINAARLPVRGDGYFVPPTWSSRGLFWGTDELVAMVVHSTRQVAQAIPHSRVYIADLSRRDGGHSTWHRSHQTGRDVDILFYLKNKRDRGVAPPETMLTIAENGAVIGHDEIRFDTQRNWQLVKELLQNPYAQVQYIFIAEHLKARLLAHAIGIGEPMDFVAGADAVMRQPSDSLAHDDHMHVRIYCPAGDRSLGCHEFGPLRWHKKGYKYLAAPSAPMPPFAGAAAHLISKAKLLAIRRFFQDQWVALHLFNMTNLLVSRS